MPYRQNFVEKSDHGYMSYERHVYESVDDKSLSLAVSQNLT